MSVCEGLYSRVGTRVEMNGGKTRWFVVERGLRQGCLLSPLLFNIYLMLVAKEFERALLRVKLEGCWCGALTFADDVLMTDSGAEVQAILGMVEAYVSRWKVKFNS